MTGLVIETKSSSCPCSDILMVQPAQDGYGQCLTDGLDRTGDRRVLLQ
jgi:hypothetical protein